MNIYITTKDKLDLSVTLISIADCIWLLGTFQNDIIHTYHYFVAFFLILGLVLSVKILYSLMVKHHTNGKIRKEKARIIRECPKHCDVNPSKKTSNNYLQYVPNLGEN